MQKEETSPKQSNLRRKQHKKPQEKNRLRRPLRCMFNPFLACLKPLGLLYARVMIMSTHTSENCLFCGGVRALTLYLLRGRRRGRGCALTFTIRRGCDGGERRSKALAVSTTTTRRRGGSRRSTERSTATATAAASLLLFLSTRQLRCATGRDETAGVQATQ